MLVFTGKLTIGRGLNINVNALLPGSNWSTITKKTEDVSTSLKTTLIDDLSEVSCPKPVTETPSTADFESSVLASNLANVTKVFDIKNFSGSVLTKKLNLIPEINIEFQNSVTPVIL